METDERLLSEKACGSLLGQAVSFVSGSTDEMNENYNFACYGCQQKVDEIESLRKELEETKNDKEFVWTLWRQLQTTKPDVTNAVAFAIDRQNKLAEEKDARLRDVLAFKDKQLAEVNHERTELMRQLEAQIEALEESNKKLSYYQMQIKTFEDKMLMSEQLTRNSDERYLNSISELKRENLDLRSQIERFSVEKEGLHHQQQDLDDLCQRQKYVIGNQNEIISSHEQEIKSLNDDINSLVDRLKQEMSLKSKSKHQIAELNQQLEKYAQFMSEQEGLIVQFKTIQNDLHTVISMQKEVFERETTLNKIQVDQIVRKYNESIAAERLLLEKFYSFKETSQTPKKSEIEPSKSQQEASDLPLHPKAIKYDSTKPIAAKKKPPPPVEGAGTCRSVLNSVFALVHRLAEMEKSKSFSFSRLNRLKSFLVEKCVTSSGSKAARNLSEYDVEIQEILLAEIKEIAGHFGGLDSSRESGSQDQSCESEAPVPSYLLQKFFKIFAAVLFWFHCSYFETKSGGERSYSKFEQTVFKKLNEKWFGVEESPSPKAKTNKAHKALKRRPLKTRRPKEQESPDSRTSVEEAASLANAKALNDIENSHLKKETSLLKRELNFKNQQIKQLLSSLNDLQGKRGESHAASFKATKTTGSPTQTSESDGSLTECKDCKLLHKRVHLSSLGLKSQVGVIKSLKLQIQSLNEQLDTKKLYIGNLVKENQNKKELVAFYKSKMENQDTSDESKMEDMKKEFNKKIFNLNCVVKQLRRENSNMKNVTMTLKNEKKTLQINYFKLNEQHEKLEKETKSELQIAIKRNDDYRAKIGHLENQIKFVENQAELAKTEQAETQADIERLKTLASGFLGIYEKFFVNLYESLMNRSLQLKKQMTQLRQAKRAAEPVRPKSGHYQWLNTRKLNPDGLEAVSSVLKISKAELNDIFNDSQQPTDESSSSSTYSQAILPLGSPASIILSELTTSSQSMPTAPSSCSDSNDEVDYQKEHEDFSQFRRLLGELNEQLGSSKLAVLNMNVRADLRRKFTQFISNKINDVIFHEKELIRLQLVGSSS